jgi:hypothetical protein
MNTEKDKQAGERTQHTPGPWMASVNSIIVFARGQDRICTLNSNETLFPKSEREANARLIAAAPELLEACKVALNYCSQLPEGSALELRLSDAIAKAEGK